MKLYKYKSLHGDGFLQALDMIVCERIYLSISDSMNDPDEGSWSVIEHQDNNKHPDQEYLDIAKKVRKITDAQKFTCFTKCATNPLLWAHYAGGFSGIALEYEFDESTYDIREIDYTGIASVNLRQLQKIEEGSVSPQDIGILKTKAECWTYEGEYRIFGTEHDASYLCNIKPKSIILGVKDSKFSDLFKNISRKYGIAISYLNKRKEKYYIYKI